MVFWSAYRFLIHVLWGCTFIVFSCWQRVSIIYCILRIKRSLSLLHLHDVVQYQYWTLWRGSPPLRDTWATTSTNESSSYIPWCCSHLHTRTHPNWNPFCVNHVAIVSLVDSLFSKHILIPHNKVNYIFSRLYCKHMSRSDNVMLTVSVLSLSLFLSLSLSLSLFLPLSFSRVCAITINWP